MKKLNKKAFEPLDREESDLMKSLENDEWQPVKDLKQHKKDAVEGKGNIDSCCINATHDSERICNKSSHI